MRALLLVLGLAALAWGCAPTRGPAPVEDRRSTRVATPAAKPPAPKVAATAGGAPVATADAFYTVRRGDTLYSIALDNGADYRELAQWNSIDDPARIKVGQALRVKPPESRAVIGRPAIIGRIESRPLETRTAIAPQETPKLGPKPPLAVGPVEFIWPVKGKVIAGFAEPRSKGIDIDGKLGDPVVAAAPGRVTYIGNGIAGLGKLVVIKHDNGFITVYAHNRDILVKEQQSVARGQKIAELGASDADRPKLHFQIRKGAAAVDPMRYLPAL
jgi:lipoprotein NlpD